MFAVHPYQIPCGKCYHPPLGLYDYILSAWSDRTLPFTCWYFAGCTLRPVIIGGYGFCDFFGLKLTLFGDETRNNMKMKSNYGKRAFLKSFNCYLKIWRDKKVLPWNNFVRIQLTFLMSSQHPGTKTKWWTEEWNIRNLRDLRNWKKNLSKMCSIIETEPKIDSVIFSPIRFHTHMNNGTTIFNRHLIH